MEKRIYRINNPSSDYIRISELNLSVPPGVSNLFELNNSISYEQIEHSVRHGTLYAAIINGLCYAIPDAINSQAFSNDITLRKPLDVQILPSRARFTSVKNSEQTVFVSAEDTDLFEDEKVKPARELEIELNKSIASIENIEATVKQANISEKPFENRYTPPQVVSTASQQKIKNDLAMGYITCDGLTADGKRCMRQAKKGKKFCGLHAKHNK